MNLTFKNFLALTLLWLVACSVYANNSADFCSIKVFSTSYEVTVDQTNVDPSLSFDLIQPSTQSLAALFKGRVALASKQLVKQLSEFVDISFKKAYLFVFSGSSPPKF